MNEIVKVVGIIFGLALTFLSCFGLYLVAIDHVYFVDIIFVYAWLIILLLTFLVGLYLVWYHYQRNEEYLKRV